jgi:hypothetical protein
LNGIKAFRRGNMTTKKLLLFLLLAAVLHQLSATTLVVFSKNNWCNIYLDDVILAKMRNDYKAEIKDIMPGCYLIKVTDPAGNIWHEKVIYIPDVYKVILKVEPDLFEYYGPKTDQPVIQHKPVEEIRIDTDTYSLADAGILQITHNFKEVYFIIDSTIVVTGSTIFLYLKEGNHKIEVKFDDADSIEKSFQIKRGKVTWLKLN